MGWTLNKVARFEFEGKETQCSADGNNLAWECRCGHPLLFTYQNGKRGSAPSTPTSCPKCRSEFFLVPSYGFIIEPPRGEFHPPSLVMEIAAKETDAVKTEAHVHALPTSKRERFNTHAKLRETKEYQDELKFLGRTRDSFVTAFAAVTLYSSRSPYLNGKSLLFADSTDILESAVSYPHVVSEGVLNAPRRELRYVLETVCTHYYVDQMNFDRPLPERVTFLESLGRQPKIELLTQLDFEAFDEPTKIRFVNDVSQLYSYLCEYVHPSVQQVEERARRALAGRTSGLEGVEDLKRLNRDVFRTLDVVLTVYFHALSLSLTADIFIQLLDDLKSWKFHKGRWCAVVSRTFNAKLERKEKGIVAL